MIHLIHAAYKYEIILFCLHQVDEEKEEEKPLHKLQNAIFKHKYNKKENIAILFTIQFMLSTIQKFWIHFK